MKPVLNARTTARWNYAIHQGACVLRCRLLELDADQCDLLGSELYADSILELSVVGGWPTFHRNRAGISLNPNGGAPPFAVLAKGGQESAADLICPHAGKSLLRVPTTRRGGTRETHSRPRPLRVTPAEKNSDAARFLRPNVSSAA